MIRPDVLLYDWDDTLVDCWSAIAAAMNAAFAAFGMPPWSVQEVRARARRSLREAFPDLFGPDWPRAREIFYAKLEEEHLGALSAKPGVEALLDIGRAWPQGVVSNKSGPVLRREIAHLRWQDRFDIAIGSGDAPADKPDPAPLRLALSALALPSARHAWYIGDSAIDMKAARAAGCTAVLLGNAEHDGGVQSLSPDIHAPDAAALAALLRKIA
jgi:phosphoglycolate phosphatase